LAQSQTVDAAVDADRARRSAIARRVGMDRRRSRRVGARRANQFSGVAKCARVLDRAAFLLRFRLVVSRRTRAEADAAGAAQASAAIVDRTGWHAALQRTRSGAGTSLLR